MLSSYHIALMVVRRCTPCRRSSVCQKLSRRLNSSSRTTSESGLSKTSRRSRSSRLLKISLRDCMRSPTRDPGEGTRAFFGGIYLHSRLRFWQVVTAKKGQSRFYALRQQLGHEPELYPPPPRAPLSHRAQAMFAASS